MDERLSATIIAARRRSHREIFMFLVPTLEQYNQAKF